MAQHVDKAADLKAPRLSKAAFYAALRGGDLVFCSGHYAISSEIEKETKSPWSHVLMAWIPAWAKQWLTLEATIHRGVHVGLLADYIDSYDGDIVLCRRKGLGLFDVYKMLNAGLALLDDGYDWQQEVSVAARKLVHFLPLIEPRGEYYCSGLQYAMSLAAPPPLQRPSTNFPTPEDNFTDPSVEVIAVLDRSL